MSKAAVVAPREQTSFDRIADRSFRVGIIGLGYVGLPLARTFARNGFACTGFDIDPGKIEKLNGGDSYIRHLDAEVFSDVIADGRFTPTTDFSRIDAVDACIICVPTPLTATASRTCPTSCRPARRSPTHLRPGQLVVLECTTYPGTTRDVVQPILERGGLKAGTDFFLAFSPEREDPGNPNFATRDHPQGGRRRRRRVASTWPSALYERGGRAASCRSRRPRRPRRARSSRTSTGPSTSPWSTS